MAEVDSHRQLNSIDLIGRDHELRSLSAFLDRLDKDGEALLALGGPGVGKSVLLDAAAAEATARGWRVLRAFGTEFEVDVSYAAVGQALTPLLRELSELDRTHRLALSAAFGFADGFPDRLAMSNAMLALLGRASRVDPVLLVIDDVQWLDRASAAVFGMVARRLSGYRIGVLAGARVGEPGFFESAGIPELEVGPLDRAASSQLLSARLPALAPRVRERILTESLGNPLAILELPRALTDLQRSGMAPLPDVLPRGRRLRGLFDSRVSTLPPETRDLLLTAAFDRSGDLRVLSALGSDVGLRTLAPAEAAGLIRIDASERQLVFRHPLIRTAVVELATPEQQREAHAALAELVADQPELRAWHLAEASVEPSEEVATLLEENARRMLHRGDAVGAVMALTRAADLTPRGLAQSRRLIQAAYIGGDVTGDLLSVTRLLDDARLVDADAARSLEAATAAAWVLITLDGNIETAHRLLVAAIELQGDEPAALETSFEDALYTLEIICYFAARADLWNKFDDLLRQLGPRAPYLLVLYGRTSADPVRTTESTIIEMDELIDSLPSETNISRIIRITLLGTFLDRLPQCRAALWRVVEDGRAGGAIASAIQALILLAQDDRMTGQWDEAQNLASEALRLADEHGYGLWKWTAPYVSGYVAAGRGDFKTARAVSDAMLRWAVPRQVSTTVQLARQIRCVAALGRGDFEEAFQEADAISPAGRRESHVPNLMWMWFDLVEAAVGADRVDEARAYALSMSDADVARLSPRMAMLSAAASAMVAPPDRAGALFHEAITIPGADRWAFELARIQLAYGRHLRRARDVAASRAQLSAALDAFDRLGAQPWAARARNELRATGQSLGTATFVEDPTLTDQELEIAKLAALGLTNREIGERLYLSHRTVGAHLHRTFPKLGITTRAALRDALTDLGSDALVHGSR